MKGLSFSLSLCPTIKELSLLLKRKEGKKKRRKEREGEKKEEHAQIGS